MAGRNPRLNPDQFPLDIIVPATDWVPPTSLPAIETLGPRVAVDLECRDDSLAAGRGAGWAVGAGYIAGVAVADVQRSFYAPLRHPDTECLDPTMVRDWLRALFKSGREIVSFVSSYDLGWMLSEWDLATPPKLHDPQCMATMLDENRLSYSLDDVCAWFGVPGKDESLLKEAALAYGLGRTNTEVKSNLWRLPARFVGPYAAQDVRPLLQLMDRMWPLIEQQNLQAAYQLEMDLLPMTVAMRKRGIRIDLDKAATTQKQLYAARDDVLTQLTEKIAIGRRIGMPDLHSPVMLERIFEAEKIPFPRTAKTGKGSFEKDWMKDHEHWLPKAVVQARSLHDAADKFIGNYLMDYAHKGRVHAEIHQFRADDGGTRSHRFSYSDPPLQQMPSRDENIAAAIRGCFIPEQGEVWGCFDFSQQEYRMIVHFASLVNATRAEEAVRAYQENPKTDFHALVAEWTGLARKPAKDANFAKAFGAGVAKFALMINKPQAEAKAIYEQYDRELPFVSSLSKTVTQRAEHKGYIVLIDGARCRFDLWEPSYARDIPYHPATNWEEAKRRVGDKTHDWFGLRLRRAFTHKAANRLIQGSAARQTKLVMRACYQEGFLPLLQMHDELDFSVSEEPQVDRIIELMRDTVKLSIPMMVDAELGPNWGDVKARVHDKPAKMRSWAESKEMATRVGGQFSLSGEG